MGSHIKTKEHNNIAIIGIDGASWNVLLPLIRKGKLPTFEKLINNGVQGILKSIIPPVTGAAWLAIATGLNPGKTGVIDFFKNTGKFTLELVNSSDYRNKSLWDFASLLGLKVSVLDYPLLYPAYPINGIMLSSWGNKISTYPSEILNAIKSLVKNYEIFVDYHLEKYDDIDLFLKDLEKAAYKKFKVSRFILKKDQWNLFIDIISFTDWLQHRMWHYIDPKHPLHSSGEISCRYREKFIEFWQRIDEYLSDVVTVFDNVFIISDHGFGPQWGVFNLAKWLLKNKLMVLRKSFMRSVISVIVGVMSRTKIYKVIPRKLRRKAREHSLSPSDIMFHIDLRKSKIILLKYTIPFGAIHINPKYKDYHEIILRDIKTMLRNIGQELNKNLKVKIWEAKKLYKGEKVHLLPDLIFTINDWSCVIEKDMYKEYIYAESTYSPRHTGSHRLYGIFIAYGKNIKNLSNSIHISVLDIAPTVLYMLNAPIPNNMDGKVLKGILRLKKFQEPKYVNPLYYQIKYVKKQYKL